MRHLSAIAVALFTSLVCQSAWAQECTSDADCTAGDTCSLPTEPDCSGADCPTSQPGVCVTMVPTCATDADCGEGFICGGTAQSGERPACEDPEDCPEPEPDPNPEPLGYCVLAPLTCTSDADCPSPLFCVEHQIEQDCTVALGDTTPCEPVVETTELCTYVIADCATNADCADGYECVTTPGGETCTVSGTTCPVGEECPEPVEVCETEPDWNMCFPVHVPCATDADCVDDWICYDFVEEGALPPWWEADGNTRACLPSGIVAVIEGQAEFEDQGVRSVADAAASGSGSNDEAADVDTSKTSGDSGGCSVSSKSSGSKGIAGLIMLGLAFGLARRRRRVVVR